MPDIIKDFQDKYHPCAKCCVRICCSSYCDPRDDYHSTVYKIIEQYFHWTSYKFQFCFGKLIYFHLSDFKVKQKMLLRPTRPVRQISSKGSMFKIIIKELIKEIENGL